LKNAGINLMPLMLVQVATSEKTTTWRERARI